ncbi:Methylmalonate semialdehyde dehydrogenase [acylating] [Aquisphaera giovannonii]|uniref:methylmalonate-semialdehyde dehydrogenase (CoA acylating) n=1 Tax=Aquisphaera giovannonii TaxID=406548 RepID=A0A5B9W743_9BACT|nr:CoA-acylating methylmalonate-semialdehyde dehydrogenase [Aquisphaera giovannonii]QEH35750.1 Methylmalonate semialdehyde dehydrogenase [acylating] [Aquisphaera giovannonii]
MSSIASPGGSPATSPHSAAARNLIGGTWVEGRGDASRDIHNPADTAEMLASVREAAPDQVDEACAAAARALPGWRATPAAERARILFRFREFLEENFSEVARGIVRENGKLLSEARGSLRRGLDVVEFACGIPSQMMGQALADVSRDVDCLTFREPMGVVVGIPPFNFPALIPLWMMSVAVACGNAFILKPAEKAPLTGTGLVEMFADAGLPPGVVGVVQGSKDVSERLIADPHVQAVSFVGTSAVAESVYRLAAAHGKRVQAHGGAKNHLLILPDADLERILPELIGSCFGSAGQRCLAGSVLVAVGDRARQDAVADAFLRAAGELRLGDGLDDAATLCPVVNPVEERRIRAAIGRGEAEGARLRLDGRSQSAPHRPRGCFLGPTIFDDVTPDMFIGREELFGPVVSLMRAPDLDAAITLANRSRYGNTACLFTQSGAATRTFRERIQAGMLGVNVGVPAPMGFFPFGGWKDSIYGYHNTQGADAVAFYTRKKVVTERWFGCEAPKDGWS